MIIGLTGGIACGKSTVSAYLREKGIAVIDADKVARQVVEPGSPGLVQIRDTFGMQYLQPDGSLNRELLGRKVFAEPEALKKLNSITGPLILDELKKQLAVAESVIVLDAALLLEDEAYHQLVDQVWVVTAGDNQLERLIARNGYSFRQAKNRIASQMTDEQRLRFADAVIDNSGTLENTHRQIDELLVGLKVL
ncbi:MAG: dephospho-CoA kinase [Peptococcaceae bacterium]|nr:dephospho-CoA kinase [Peptococcaceae bacterium]MBR2627081.1 dephospho-CoA kinase [Peptococcaceae bacterium]